jgi:hypothetical protein
MDRKTSEVGTANTQILVDSPRSPVADLSLEIQPLSSRASLYVAFLRSEPVRADLAKRAGLSPNIPLSIETSGSGVTRTGAQTAQTQAGGIAAASTNAHLVIFSVQDGLPLINVKTQAPTEREALALATAATQSARDYVENLQSQQAVAPINRVGLRTIGPPVGSLVTAGPDITMVWVVAIGSIFGLWMLVLLVDAAVLAVRVRRARQSLESETASSGSAAEHEFGREGQAERVEVPARF